MPTYISLLRGINVGGQRKIRMADLAAAYEVLGLKNVNTYVQSGNVVFDTGIRSAAEVASAIEEKIRSRFGFDVTVLVRTTRELAAVVEGNPFAAQAAEDPAKVHVTFLAARPGREPIRQIEGTDAGGDAFFLRGQEVYLHCPGGYGRTKLNNTFFERKLKMPATTRNWKTVQALHEMAVGP